LSLVKHKYISAKYKWYKDKFKLPENDSLILFEKLLYNSKDSYLECSHKISGDVVHSSRLNLWYDVKNRQTQDIEAIVEFKKHIGMLDGVHITDTLLAQVIGHDLDPDLIKQAIVGVDIRKELKKSRLKHWFILRNCDGISRKAFSYLPWLKNPDDYIVHEEILIGVDLCFDGSTRLKVYPRFDNCHLNDPKLLSKINLHGKASEIASHCTSVHLTFEGEHRRILHFHANDLLALVKEINNIHLTELVNQAKHMGSINTITLTENEINDGEIETINLYY